MNPKEPRAMRLAARTTPAALAVVKQAAEIEGRSVSDFVIAAAHAAAKRTIEQTHLIRLLADEQRRFVDLLINPPDEAPTLERARQAHAALIRPTQ